MQGSGSVRIRRSKRASVALEAAIGAVVLTAASAYGLQAYQEIALATDLKRMTTVLAESVAKLDIARNVGRSPTSLDALDNPLLEFFAPGVGVRSPAWAITNQFLQQYGGVPDAMNVHDRTIDLKLVEVEAALIDFRAISLNGDSVNDTVTALDLLLALRSIFSLNEAQLLDIIGIPPEEVEQAGLRPGDVDTFLDIYEDLGNSGNRVNPSSGGTTIFLPRFLGPSPTDTTYKWSAGSAGSGGSCAGNTALTVENVVDSGSGFGGLRAEITEDSSIEEQDATNPNVRGKSFLADHVQVMALVRSCVRIRNRMPGGGDTRDFVAVHAVPISDQLVPFDGDDSQSSTLGEDAGRRAASCWGGLPVTQRNGHGILRCLIF
jgi:hypothetical protein